jgi:ribulose-5-phosphate 4-epimerase/fuculose-1-phosphate aldolase
MQTDRPLLTPAIFCLAILSLLAAATAAFCQSAVAPDSDSSRTHELVTANHILADQGILDGFGHVSFRSVKNPSHYFMAWARAPGAIEADDIMEFDENSNPIDPKGRKPYSERFIHGEVYRLRGDVQAIVHSHSRTIIPFSVSDVPLRPVSHMAGFLPQRVSVFEIRDAAGADNQMLVNSQAMGAALAKAMGLDSVILIRGHGDVVTGQSIRLAVMHAIYTEFNAQIEMEALRLGLVTYLNPTEAANVAVINDAAVDRPWEIWAQHASTLAAVRH